MRKPVIYIVKFRHPTRAGKAVNKGVRSYFLEQPRHDGVTKPTPLSHLRHCWVRRQTECKAGRRNAGYGVEEEEGRRRGGG